MRSSSQPWSDSGKSAIAALLLALLTTLLFLPSVEYQFLDTMDDGIYVLQNPMVLDTFSSASLSQAFTETYAASYQPLVWVSFMADYKLFGLDPMGYHLENILWHALNSALLFWLLRSATGSFWKSFVAALLFAIHPLRVESVAWVTERKDVLSAFFLLITLFLYLDWAKRRRYLTYAALCIAFTLSLMAKAMAVTLPFLLLLLDYWPLQRWSMESFSQWRSRLRLLLVEKIPLLVIALLFCFATLLGAKNDAALSDYGRIPLPARILSAFVSIVEYVRKTILPYDLAPFYPHPIWWPWSVVVPAILVVCIASLVALRFMRRWPHVFSGWFFFLIALAPVLGIVQAGTQPMADRFTYIPCWGLAWALVWSMAGIFKRFSKAMTATTIALILSIYGWITWDYLPNWRNSGTVFERSAAWTDQNYVAHLNVSVWHLTAGDYEKALPHLIALIKLRPQESARHLNLGIALAELGQDRLAYAALDKSIELGEPTGNALFQQALLLQRAGQPALAEEAFAKAYNADPSNISFAVNYARILADRDKVAALTVVENALKTKAGRHPDTRPGLEQLQTQLQAQPRP